MKKRIQYSYSVLRYVHDINTGEFVNVGVVVYSCEANYFSSKFRTSFSRVTNLFPKAQASSLRKLVAQVKKRCDSLEEQINDSLSLSRFNSFEHVLHQIIVSDDSSLMWSPASHGATFNLEKLDLALFSSLVVKYDVKNSYHGKSDDDLWRVLKKDLKSRKVADVFKEKVIKSPLDEDGLLFRHAWKNGIWHMLEPISFDLSAKDSIKDKAYKYYGQYASVAEAREDFKLYLLLGKPSDSKLNEAFESAVNLLKKLPVESEIFTDDNFVDLADTFARKIQEHNKLA